MKITRKCFILLLTFLFCLTIPAEIIEKVYAVVNDQIITFSEYQKREQSLINQLRTRLSGKKLTQEINKLKKELLNRIIDRKLLLSKAKTLDYDVENDIKMMLDAIKKQNNMKTDAQLIEALKNEGIGYDDFVDLQKEERLIKVYIYQEIESKIKIGSSEIMEYYRKNTKEFTVPKQISLNCIFLNPANYVSELTLNDKKNLISEELKTTDFKTVAQKHTDYQSKTNKEFLGNFKMGELDNKIEDTALSLKKGEFSDWISTENGSYMIQLKEIVPAKLKKYKDVRTEIEKKINQVVLNEKMTEYVKKLREESYIKIYK